MATNNLLRLTSLPRHTVSITCLGTRHVGTYCDPLAPAAASASKLTPLLHTSSPYYHHQWSRNTRHPHSPAPGNASSTLPLAATAAAAAAAASTALYTTYNPVHAEVDSSFVDVHINTIDGDGDGDGDGEDTYTASAVIEPQSGTSFPTTLHNDTFHLAGTGCRVMRGLVRVYAIAVYLRPEVARALLRPWRQFGSTDLSASDAVWEALSSPSGHDARGASCGAHILLRVEVVREVAGTHMAEGFERAIAPRAADRAKRGGGVSPRVAKARAKELCKGFRDVGMMKVGSVAELKVDADSVELVVDGRVVTVVREPVVAWAVVDMYLGNKGVVTGLRDQVANGVVDMLREE